MLSAVRKLIRNMQGMEFLSIQNMHIIFSYIEIPLIITYLVSSGPYCKINRPGFFFHIPASLSPDNWALTTVAPGTSLFMEDFGY
jgi:hypothetical protein